jgi:hypothetical protein
MKKKYSLMLTAVLLLCVLVAGWRTYGQGRPSVPVPKGWDYMYDTASKSFPTAADKTKIIFYDSGGWELIAVVRDDTQNVLVFKRPKQMGK